MSIELKSPVSQLVGGARGKVLETIARVGRPFSIRQIAEMSGVHHTQASELLREFEGMGLVHSRRVGRSIAYEPIETSALLKSVRTILLLRQEIIRELEAYARDTPPDVTLALFGSVVTGRATAGSDIDVLVIVEDESEQGTWVDGFLAFAKAVSGMPVNPLRYTRSEWDTAKVEGDLITRTITDTHLTLAGKL